MKKKIIKIELNVLKTIQDDLGYLECSLCDRTFHKVGVTYYDLETDSNIATICEDCLKKIEVIEG